MVDPGLRLLLLVALLGASCSASPRFDSVAWLRRDLTARLGAEAAAVEIPFELDSHRLQSLLPRLPQTGSEERRAAALVDFLVGDLELRYRATPTGSAAQVLESRSANCLSFVNLFVALARAIRLPAFYVEVEDAQTWNVVSGTVVSRGHIVAGLHLGGSLRTYDFLPERRSFRRFRPIEDRLATAHFLNNLGAEALLAGDVETGCQQVERAVRVAPEFARGWNNVGVCRQRRGDLEGAKAALLEGLRRAPEDPPLLTNLLRLYQLSGATEEALKLAKRLEALKVDHPLFYLFLAEEALMQAEAPRALELAREAYRRASELPEVHLLLARIYLALGDPERARHHLARVLQLDATHREAKRLLEALSSG